MKEVGKAKLKTSIGCRIYNNITDRRRAISNLKRIGYNYFVGYLNNDKRRPAGLSFGYAEWAGLFPFEKDVGG